MLDLEQRVDDLERVVGAVQELVWAQLVKATALTPAKFRDAIGEAIASV